MSAICFTATMAVERTRRTPEDDVVDLGLEILGRGLLRARLGANLTQALLEELSGVDQTTISRLENGRLAGLRLRKVAALVAALNGFPIVDDRPIATLQSRKEEISQLRG